MKIKRVHHRLGAAAIAATLVLAACGSDSADGNSAAQSTAPATASETTAAASETNETTAPASETTETTAPTSETTETTAPTSETTAAGAEMAAGEFPVTVEHAFGTTEIPAAPQRVVTWGWGSTEAAIAVGTFPVAIAQQEWTVGVDNLLPWVKEAYDEAGVEYPILLTDDYTNVPYEEIIAVDPDLILATYSGINEEQFGLMNDIAPTVAYPEAAWTTPWEENIELVAEALGQPAKGEEIVTEINDYMAEQRAAHPEFEGVTIAAFYDGDGTVSLYTEEDSRLKMLTDLGFEVAPSIAELNPTPGSFYFDMSYEEADKIDADVLISYHDDEAAYEAFLAKPEAQAIPAVAAGNVAPVIGREYISSVSPPTALSVTWGLPDLIDTLSEVVAAN